MNYKQKSILVLAMVAVILSLLFPPWLKIYKAPIRELPATTEHIGYQWILDPPIPGNYASCVIDYNWLILQQVCIVLCTVGLILLFKPRPRTP